MNEHGSSKPSLVWRALHHQMLTPIERVYWNWMKTVALFIGAFIISYFVDAVIHNRDFGSINLYQDLAVGIGYLVLSSIYKYLMATGQANAGIIIGQALDESRPMAEQRGRVVIPDIPDIPKEPPQGGSLPC